MPEETPVSEQLVYQAKPTLRFDGQPEDLVTELLLSLVLHEAEGGLSSLEFTVSNIAPQTDGSAQRAFDDDSVLRLGRLVTVYSGDENAPTEIFRGKITALEANFPRNAAPELTVLAEDLLQQARMKRRTKLHDPLILSDLIGAIASDLSLTPVVAGLTDDLGPHLQFNESDLAFARRMLSRYDADLQVVAEELHVSPRADVRRGDITLELFSQLRTARITADLAHQVSDVTVTAWDPAQGARISATSQAGSLQPGGGSTGTQKLEEALAPRSEHISHIPVSSTTEAQALADAIYHQRARRFVSVEGLAEGNPKLRVGTHATLTGLGRFDNTYYVTEVTHRYDLMRGYETEFCAECAYLGGA